MIKTDESGPITIGYWNIRGLGAGLRMMAMYAQCPLNAINYDVENPFTPKDREAASWFTTHKPLLKEKNELINLPYVLDGDILVSQSNACFSYLGKKFRLWGATLVEEIKCEELLCEIMDIRNTVVGFAYGRTIGSTPIKDAAPGFLAGLVNGSFAKLENIMKANESTSGGRFLITDHATAPDFHLWEMLDECHSISVYYNIESPLESLPALKAFHTQFAALPNNAKYLACPLIKLPYNQKSAIFGSTPNGDQFVKGQTYDWTNTDGLYC